jgi:hypothetical protein
MNSFRILDRQVRRIVAAVVLLSATVMPALVPALVSAETVTSRSVELSSSTKDASNVTYNVHFTTVASSTGAFAIDFCTTAAIGDTCTVSSGFSTSGVSTSGAYTVSAINSNKGVKVVLDSAVNGGTAVSVDLKNIHNPTNAGVMYARIVTYTDGTAPGSGGNWNYTDPATLGSYLDAGAVALTITDGFSVSGSVLESLTFCASAPGAGNSNPITSGCGGTLTAPNVVLGTNGVLTTTLSEGTIYTQLSTNAAHGAVVSLKNSTTGGGLKRVEATDSDIKPMSTAGAFSGGDAKFGLKLGNLGATTGSIVKSGNYDTTNYYMGYASNGSTGVTSAYGDPIYNTGGNPVSDGSADLTFGANISNVTPAGNYSAALGLIATGTF